jgi:ring-1,2-phenylacetyl-CoA epoxidase subunit PaaE
MSGAAARTRFFPLRIREVRRETPDAVSVAFEVPDELRAAFRYAPGQYLTLRATLGGEELRRDYSICSGLDDDELRVVVKQARDGTFSHHANTALRAGDVIEVMSPAGRFGTPIVPDEARLHVGFAAGSGITPIMAILKTVLSREPHSRFILFYGSRSTTEIIFREALQDLKDRFLDRLTVFHLLSREEQDIPVLAGRLDAQKVHALLPGVVAPTTIDHAFICGPASMVDVLPAVLRDLGVPADRVHVERFTPAGGLVRAPRPTPVRADAPAFATAIIIHDGKTNEVPVADGEAVLEAGLRAGLNLPWSCRGGMCSTCRAKLRDGAVTMAQNYALEPWETGAGYILTCQSHPTTRHLTVDYDQV